MAACVIHFGINGFGQFSRDLFGRTPGASTLEDPNLHGIPMFQLCLQFLDQRRLDARLTDPQRYVQFVPAAGMVGIIAHVYMMSVRRD